MDAGEAADTVLGEDKGVGMDVGEVADTGLGEDKEAGMDAGEVAGTVLGEESMDLEAEMGDDEAEMEMETVEETAGETNRRQHLLLCNSLQHFGPLLQPMYSGIESRHPYNFQLRKPARYFRLH